MFCPAIGDDRGSQRKFPMQPTDLSSSVALADRRADYARMLAGNGEHAGAAELMEQALELAPEWPAGWFQLAGYREKSGDAPGAVIALRRVLLLDPGDMLGAGLRLGLLGAEPMPPQPPSRYVEALFDDYAGRFDASLVEALDYRVPRKLAALLTRIADRPAGFALAVDLGCGTGLVGRELRDRVDRLEGFDLSDNMLAKAGEKAIYDYLGRADLSLPACRSGVFAENLPPGRADLATAADVMIYLGDLENLFLLVSGLLAPGGLFAFSVEDSREAEGFALLPSMRYAHSAAYIEALIERHGFAPLDREYTTLRKDGAEMVTGILFVAARNR